MQYDPRAHTAQVALASAQPEDGLVVDAYPGEQPQGVHVPPDRKVPAAQNTGCAEPPAQPYDGGHRAHANVVHGLAVVSDKLPA